MATEGNGTFVNLASDWDPHAGHVEIKQSVAQSEVPWNICVYSSCHFRNVFYLDFTFKKLEK